MDGSKHSNRLPSIKLILSLMTGITLLIFVGMIVLVFVTSMLDMLGKHERENIRQESNVAVGIIMASNANIQSVTRDWSSWDETYAFALGENDAYVEDILTEYPFLLHNLNFSVIKDLQGEDLYAEFYDYLEARSMSVPEGFTDYLDPISEQMLDEYVEDIEHDFMTPIGKDGFIFYEGVCYYICVMPVLTSDETSDPAGTFYFGRILNESEIDRITGYRGLDCVIIERSSPEIQDVEFNNKEAFSFTDSSFVYYRTLPDIFGKENIVLREERPRNLYDDGLKIVLSTCIAICFAALITMGVMAYLLNRNFLRPIAKLTSEVESITVDTSSISDKDYDKNREFHILKSSINQMLSRLEQDRIHIRESSVSINVLKNILNGMDAYLYVSDLESDEILFINDKMKKHFGLEDDAIGSICWQVLQSGLEKRCDFCPCYKLTDEQDDVCLWEEHNSVTDRYYRNIDCIIEWSNGKKAHLQHSTDITDMKFAQMALNRRLEQQELMSAISLHFTSARDSSNLIDEALKMAGEFMNVNQAFLSIYNRGAGELECVHEWYDEKAKSFVENESRWPITPDMQIYKDLTEKGYAAISDFDAMRHPNYKAVTEHDLSSFLNIPVEVSGQLWGILGFIVYEKKYEWNESDISLGKLIAGVFSAVISRKIAEESLFDANQRLEAVLENAPMAIFWKDKDLVYRGVNAYFENFQNKKTEEMVGKNDHEIFDSDLADQIADLDKELLNSGETVSSLDFQIINGYNQNRWIHVNRSIITDAKGQPTMIIGVFEDVTDQKEMESEIIGAKEAAEQANRAKSEFLSRMSHEIRTPMNAIIGMTGIAQGSKDPEKKDYCLGKINDASTHLLGVINDILDMSKIEANKVDISLMEFDFERMIQKVMSVVNFRIYEKHQELTLDIDENIPDVIVSDDQRLAQVITNLLSNAVKFTPEHGLLRLSAKLIGEEDGMCVIQVEVADTGVGINEEQRARIFNPFEQAENSTSRKFGGTGLGLAISKSIVEMMGGRIWVESELGKGSVFAFTIKAARGVGKSHGEDNISTGEGDQKETAVAGCFEGFHVILAEDVEINREIVLSLLEETLLSLDCAKNGQEAVDLFKENPARYDAILMDVQMPEMDGYEATKVIRALGIPEAKTVPIIAMTANVFREDIEKCIETGMNSHLGKPLNIEEVMETLRRYLFKQ